MVFSGALDLLDEFIHEPQVALVLFPEVVFTDLGGELLAFFCSEGHPISLLKELSPVRFRYMTQDHHEWIHIRHDESF